MALFSIETENTSGEASKTCFFISMLYRLCSLAISCMTGLLLTRVFDFYIFYQRLLKCSVSIVPSLIQKRNDFTVYLQRLPKYLTDFNEIQYTDSLSPSRKAVSQYLSLFLVFDFLYYWSRYALIFS